MSDILHFSSLIYQRKYFKNDHILFEAVILWDKTKDNKLMYSPKDGGQNYNNCVLDY